MGKRSLTVPGMILAALLLRGSSLYAGGPLATVNGSMVVYDSSRFPLTYSPDQGTLGSLSNARATALVDEAFDVWNSVATASIRLENAGSLSEDVVASNFDTYYNFTDGLNPIIFDSDGAIIDSQLGLGASDSVIGFAGSDYDSAGGLYTEGVALLNGKFTDVFTYEQFKATFVHEFGHLIGLDHCQLNGNYVHDGITSNDIYVPTMYPTAADDDTSLGDLNPDDQAALTLLYPAADGSHESSYATIEGTVTWDVGGPVLGANVVAVQTADSDFSRFSSVSDYFQLRTGAYRMYVTPGTYSLFIEPINREFTGGSSVGPYAESLVSESFTTPVVTAYYETEVTVSAGETVAGIDFIAQPASVCVAEAVLEGRPEEIRALQNFRDRVLSKTAPGRKLVSLYYRLSPGIQGLLSEHAGLRPACRRMLTLLAPVAGRLAGAGSRNYY